MLVRVFADLAQPQGHESSNSSPLEKELKNCWQSPKELVSEAPRAKFQELACQSAKEMGSNLERIPEGKGPYSVGCTDLMTGHSIQGSFLRLYYPSQIGTSDEETIWIPNKEYYYGLSDFLNINRTLGGFFFTCNFGSVTCPAKWNAAFKLGEKYPLIIFSHGLGAFRTLYSAICTEMASRGFVVAAVEHRDQSSSATYYLNEKPALGAKGEASELHKEWIYYRKLKAGEDEVALRQQQVQQRADECVRALDLMLDINSGKQIVNVLPLNFNWMLLKDSIDVQKIAVMGHSFGAATTIEALSKNVQFKGTVHQSFPDFTFLTGNIVGKIFGLKGQLNPKTAIDVSNKASLAFLQKHLGLNKDFDQWDSLLEGKGHDVIPGTNIDLPPMPPQSKQ
ncbi:platelet-activating factor acetylhydrolase isoform X2 [Podarcis raffonei]|uniref:platelet-activating factor acetylhydrolase isoform X2 n=1 Tax=Podarcis raffonei TaxID=65483 RepID=UPI002329727E|nr:platelet-activating factor acetylhydrolase isoform X2 [Podarcis raffonei]